METLCGVETLFDLQVHIDYIRIEQPGLDQLGWST